MKTHIDISPVCDQCGSELAITRIVVNRAICAYEIHAECILSGHTTFYILSLADFINLEILLGGSDDSNKT